MRKDIKIELVEAPGRPGEFAAFKMRYSAGSPELAREVNSELTTLFIDENVKAQRNFPKIRRPSLRTSSRMPEPTWQSRKPK